MTLRSTLGSAALGFGLLLAGCGKEPVASDTTPPEISATFPENGASAVGVNTPVRAMASEELDSASITGVNFTLSGGASGTVTYVPSEHSVVFTPSAALAYATQYTATVEGLRDASGNTLAAPYSWSFTTAAAPDTEAPAVLSHTPVMDALNVPVAAAITATFSEPVTGVDETSFTLLEGTKPVPGTVTLLGNVATFTPTAPLACSHRYTATLGTEIADEAHNPLASTSWSFETQDVGSWSYVDSTTVNGLNRDPTQNVTRQQLTAFAGKLYATWIEANPNVAQVRVAVMTGTPAAPGWAFADGGGTSGLNKSPTRGADMPQLTSYGSKLYAIWTESNGTTMQTRVAVYGGDDANPSWTFVDGNGTNGINHAASKHTVDPQLTAVGTKLYATWAEQHPSTSIFQIRVAVMGGTEASPSWAFVDLNGLNGLNKDPTRHASRPHLVALGSKLYAVWEEVDATNQQQVRVSVFNGNDAAPSWTFVDGNGPQGINQAGAYDAQVTAYQSKLYATWSEVTASSVWQVRVAVYNGNDAAPAWTIVSGPGLNADLLHDADYPRLAVLGSKLYATWRQWTASANTRPRVAVYNGNDAVPAWSFVDGNVPEGISKDPTRDSEDPLLTVVGNALYAGWREFNGMAHQFRVAVGGPP